MIELIKVERNKTAPRRMFSHSSTSNWKTLFASMKAGDWFVIDQKYRGRLGAAGNSYLKGKYTLYKHPEQNEKYVFLKLK